MLLFAGWCNVQKTVNVFSEKYLKFFTIKIFCTLVHLQCIWCSAQICNSFKIEICSNKRIIICGWNKKPNQLSTKSINTPANDEAEHFQFIISINMEHIKWAICFICSFFYCFLLTHWYIDTLTSPFLSFSFEILTPYFKDMISVICL